MSHDLIEMRLIELSERIRRGREADNLTLVQLSERSGVSPSTIQKIESRQMTPSIAVIFKIAIGLGMEPADLIAAGNPSQLDIVLQRAGQHAQMNASDDLRFDKLSADLLGSDLECWCVSVSPNYQVRLVRPQKFDEQIFVCLGGRIEFDIDGEKYRLSKGDTLHAKSKTLFEISNPGARAASYLMAGRFPHEIGPELMSMINQGSLG
ncbi:MAG TPA: helix-turn-helix domain-containing protein [Sphingobium sp.]|nr:helix-turn-helix domain-containing protein [Sphingobium sp.]